MSVLRVPQTGDRRGLRQRGAAALALGRAVSAGPAPLPARHAGARAAQQRFQHARASRAGKYAITAAQPIQRSHSAILPQNLAFIFF